MFLYKETIIFPRPHVESLLPDFEQLLMEVFFRLDHRPGDICDRDDLHITSICPTIFNFITLDADQQREAGKSLSFVIHSLLGSNQHATRGYAESSGGSTVVVVSMGRQGKEI